MSCPVFCLRCCKTVGIRYFSTLALGLRVGGSYQRLNQYDVFHLWDESDLEAALADTSMKLAVVVV